MTELLPRSASGEPAAVYLLWGADEGAIRGAVKELRDLVLGAAGGDGGMTAFNHEIFEASRLAAAAVVLNACEQLPLFSSRRLIELAGPEEFGKHFRAEEGQPAPEVRRAEAIAALIAYMTTANPRSVLVITSTGIDGKSKLVKAAKKAAAAGASVLERKYELTKDQDAVTGLLALAAERKIPLPPDAAVALVEAVGTGRAELESALERAYTFAGGVVTVEHVAAVVTTTREANVFALTDAIGRGEVDVALALLARMFALGEKDTGTAMRLFGLLLWHMRRLFVAFEAANPAAALKLPPFLAEKLRVQARQLGEARLRRAYAGLARLDGELKGGSKLAYESPYLVLQRWILDVCEALPGVDPRA